MKRCLVVILAIVLATTGAGVDWGGASAAVTESKQKINLAGRQRMLTQRMAKALCFAAIGIQKEQHLAMAQDAHRLFDQTLGELRNGGGEFNFKREDREVILSELRDVEHLWASYRDEIAKSWTLGAVDSDTLALIYQSNLPTLFQANEAVTAYARYYDDPSVHPALALAINLAGRQRMLTQKASKEFCFVLYGKNVQKNREALGKTVDLFDDSLKNLRFGNPALGLPGAPNEEIVRQFILVQDLWEPLADIFARVARGERPTAKEIEFIAKMNNDVLVEMNRAVGMYESL